MKRIFLSLAITAQVALLIALVMGLQVGDPMTAGGLDPQVNGRIGRHMLVGLAALTGTTLVHAIQLTYFMGTGRWLEETSNAYSLPMDWYKASQRLKYGLMPGIVAGFLLIVATGCFGAVADPATGINLESLIGVSDATVHFAVAMVAWFVNLVVHVSQYLAIGRNSQIVDAVLGEVRRIRIERGLPVDGLPASASS